MIEQHKKNAQALMQKAIDALTHTLASIRTSRASIHLLDQIKAYVYDSYMPIQQLASVSSPEPRVLLVQIWDAAAVKPLERAIRESSLGLSPTVDGQSLRIVLPELTQERREELARHAAHCAEESRVAIRNIRRDLNDELKAQEKSHAISEDDYHKGHKDIQKITDDFIHKIDELVEAKKGDILRL